MHVANRGLARHLGEQPRSLDPFGLNATRVSQFDVIVSSWP